jgi:hypothetical protein
LDGSRVVICGKAKPIETLASVRYKTRQKLYGNEYNRPIFLILWMKKASVKSSDICSLPQIFCIWTFGNVNVFIPYNKLMELSSS